MPETSKVKKSIVLSGLVGTGGLFIAKMIGILYAIPFSSILKNVSYQGYYGQAYNIYSYVLNVFTAGFPFAIATMVAKYSVLNDKKTVLIIKKISISMLAVMGFVGMVLMMAFAGWLAPLMVAGDGKVMANVLRILSIALFFVPVLSGFRGYYQGLKEMEEYAFSQVFEQIFRVGFLLSVSCLIVYVFHIERRWALYASVLSTSIAAIAGLLQMFHFDQKHKIKIDENEESHSFTVKELIRELVVLAIPYMVMAILGYSQQIYNAILLPAGLKMFYSSDKMIDSIISSTTYVGVKMTAIPMVLAPGFTAAIIPHITSALIENNQKLIRKNVVDCLNVVFYIGLPLSFCLFVFSQPINYTLFYTDDLNTATMVLCWLSIEAVLGTITPMITSMMMALRLKHIAIKNLVINVIMKGILMVPMTAILGFGGAVLAALISDGYLIGMSLYIISKEYKVNYKSCFGVSIKVCIGCLGLWVTSIVLSKLGLAGISGRKLIAFIQMCINGLVSVLVFAVITILLKVPQTTFHIQLGRKKAQ